jgi:hypothetical protein
MDQASQSKEFIGTYKTNNFMEGTYGQPIVKGNKNVSMLKAELVRNNLVTRTDLMRLY